MSEENTPVAETEVKATEKTESVSPEAGLIAESKKYRQRAQDAEKKLEEIEKKLQDQENQKLKDKEEYKELSEKLLKQVDDLSPYKEKFELLENSRRENLLSKLPEEKRELFKDESIKTLESIIDMVEVSKPVETPSARGSIGKQPPPTDWTTLSPKELKERWGDIVANATRKKN